jgi:hypothetical protein
MILQKVKKKMFLQSLFHFIQFLFAFEESVFAEQQKVANHL